MGVGQSGSGVGKVDDGSTERTEELRGHIVLHDVIVIEKRKIIEVPELKYIPKEIEYDKPVPKEVETIKYVPIEEKTIKYILNEVPTTKYITKEVECEKPIVTEVEYEKPVLVPKTYEQPILVPKEIEVTTIKDVELVKELIGLVTNLKYELKQLRDEILLMKNIKPVEEVVRVSKLEWYPVKVERIIWVDVPRERVVEKEKENGSKTH